MKGEPEIRAFVRDLNPVQFSWTERWPLNLKVIFWILILLSHSWGSSY